MRQSSKFILASGAALMAYEYFCDDGEMVSQRVDEWLERPIVREATLFVIGSVALHLGNVISPELDWVHKLGTLKERLKHDQ